MTHEPSSRPSARLSPTVSVFRAPAGPVHFPEASEHRLRVHASRPVAGVCGVQRFVYQRGDVDVVPPGMVDSWFGEEEGESLVITLPRPLLQRAADEMGRARADLAPRCLVRDPRIEHIAWALDAEREAGGPNGLLYAEALGLALAFHLLGGYASAAGGSFPESRTLSSNERRRVLGHIEAHIDQNLSLTHLAAVAGMSTSHFKTLFRRSMGVPVHEYVVQRRVERAKGLLQQGKLPAGEIALASGFAHQSHMARCMRRVLGVTPTQLRALE
jgi:AraC family transcriptional regulator